MPDVHPKGVAGSGGPRAGEGLGLSRFRLAVPSLEARQAAGRGPPHQHEAAPLKVTDEPLGGDPGHHLVRIVDSLAAFEPQREGQGLLDVTRGGGAEIGLIRHPPDGGGM